MFSIENRNYSIFLKVTPKGQMQSEAQMTDYLSKHGVCPNVLIYTSDESRDYLITNRIMGTDAASDEYLAQPSRLTDVFANCLSSFHRIEYVGCSRVNGLSEMIIRAEGNYKEGKAEKGILRYLGYTSVDAAYKDMVCLYGNVCEDKVIVHGDYCLPNMIVHDFENRGLIDVGYSGVGDRHYDIFWGLWSLEYNLKSDKYADRFIQAYGGQNVDQERLRLCGLLSVFNGYRGQDFYE
ncbi:aminoglycoside 3'-phosphotransferase [Cohnella silvisoli]|uniref:Aminoglycoside 3'-phosphotransferase n=1 Tax=Cohnella silvisoli TaxID=2873699 RepID=A0ABV1KS63_9BACL|nr:aminoglycoside 3'-phosphotransferase [Cohnella silvisoli]MCD9022595.1 aminoglycoside 3'-phosphotransferase [Cohnella silvisoli]